MAKRKNNESGPPERDNSQIHVKYKIQHKKEGPSQYPFLFLLYRKLTSKEYSMHYFPLIGKKKHKQTKNWIEIDSRNDIVDPLISICMVNKTSVV